MNNVELNMLGNKLQLRYMNTTISDSDSNIVHNSSAFLQLKTTAHSTVSVQCSHIYIQN